MIKANELRIGNLLHYRTAEGDILPTTLDWQDLKWITEDEKGFNKVHSPITITEEWLLKFGFEKQGISYVKFSFVIDKWTDGELMYGWIGGNIEIKYIHQLQNLYFALTGRELIFKTKEE